MAFSVINKLYVPYVRQVEQSIRDPQKKTSLSKKIHELAINWLAKILLSSSERKKIRITCQQVHDRKNISNPIDEPRACTLNGTICVTNLPAENFLDITPQPAGSYPDFLKSYASSPLCKAVLEHDLTQLKQLLAADPKKIPEKALQLAIFLGHLDEVKLFAEHGHLNNEKSQNAALRLAIKYRHPHLVKYFIEQGLDLNSKRDKPSLLACAFRAGNAEAITHLIAAGGKFKGSSRDIHIIIRHLISTDNKPVSELFLKYALEVKDYRKYKMALFELTLVFGLSDLLKELIKQGLDVKKIDQKTSVSLLIYPIVREHLAILEILIEQGVPVERADGILSPLVEAADRNFKPAIELLMKYGADVNGIESSASTPLVAAMGRGHDELADFLVKNGANPIKAQLIINQKMLTHRFAVPGWLVLDGAPPKINLEGSSSSMATREFISSLTQFFGDPQYASIPEFPLAVSQAKILKGIKESLANQCPTKSDAAVLADYEAGEMVVLTSGWKRHAAYRLLYKGFYIEVNRGRPVEEGIEPGYQIYRINAPLTEDLIKTMRKGESKIREDVQKDRRVIHQKLQLTLVTKGKYRAQQLGTCAWDNLKAVCRMMLFVEQFEKNRLANNGQPHEWVIEAEKSSTRIYKLFTKDDRARVIKEALLLYQKNPVQPLPSSLLLSTLAKFKGDEKTALELATFLKQHGVKWGLKNYAGKGFIDYIRKSHNHALIPLLTQHGLFR